MVATPLATVTPVIGTGCQLFGASVSEVSKTQPVAAAGHFTATFGPFATRPTFGCGMVMKRMLATRPAIANRQSALAQSLVETARRLKG